MSSSDLLKRQVPFSRWIIVGVVVVAVGVLVVAWKMTEPPPRAQVGQTEPTTPAAEEVGPKVHKPKPVPANRTADVRDGFGGEVHPLLHGRTRLDVTASVTPPDRARIKFGSAPEQVYGWYTGLKPAAAQATYTEREFSAFLPAGVPEVGQVWELDPERVKVFLRQLHANPSMHLVATGRRAGPDGAFATLRAVSPTHLDIAFRIHAEFFVTPNFGVEGPPVAAWFTPAYFAGRLLVNKTTGTVEHIRLALPTEKALNAFLTVNPSLLDIPVLGHDIVRVDRMELSGGDAGLADRVAWTQSLTPAEAARKLARTFYKFEEIDWLPPEQVQAAAKAKSRPIFAIVSWGSTDDQSC